MGLCPHAYSDDELLLLLSVVEKVSLDTRCILQSSVDVNALLYKIVNNIRDWDTMVCTSSIFPFLFVFQQSNSRIV